MSTARRRSALLLVMAFVAVCVSGLLGRAQAAQPFSPPTGLEGPPSAVHPVVVVGVDGLTWDQIDPRTTPTLWALAQSRPSGLLAGRGADEPTTALDAWASISAGNRARAHDLPEPLPEPGAGSPAQDPGVAVAQRQTAPARTGAKVGALADALGGRCITAVGGRGAQLAAANSRGQVGGQISPGSSSCPVVLVQSPNAAAADAEVASRRSSAFLLLVVGLGDVDADGKASKPAHLHAALADEADDSRPSPGRLSSGSTRRAPYVQAIDIAPTVLRAFGVVPPPSMVGQPWTLSDVGSFDPAAYRQADERARFMPTAVLGVVLPLVVVFVLVLGLAALLAWRGRRELAWSVALWDSRIAAAIPLATFLARLFPYESWGSGGLPTLAALWGLILAWVAVILLLCRNRVAWVAVATAVGLGLDVLLGAPLQLHSVLGYSALVAGRFAGLGNPAFGAFAAAVLLSAMLAAGALGSGAPSGSAPSDGVSPHRTRRVLAVAGIALLAIVVDGAPIFGSDVGGVLSLVPAFALLGWAAAGRRVRIRTLLGAGLAAVAVLVVFAALDLARDPESRTHLGRFASDLLAGRAGETLSRKAASNWALLTRNVATLLVVPVTAGFVVVLARTERLPGLGPLARALREVPGLRAGLGATILAGALGFVVNDSGVVIPAVMMLLVVPAAVETAARHRSPSAVAPALSDAVSTRSAPGLV
ncbi:MAG: hypothetical protein QOC80_910 [Frankiaceae bacterium]|nr:hypothetical protein [Frankiaceae bacterium]